MYDFAADPISLWPARSRHSMSSSTPYGGSVTIKKGLWIPSARATNSGCVVSPQSTRCGPHSHKSPVRDVGTSGTGGSSSSAACESVDLARVEPRQAQVEVERLQFPKLHCQSFEIPFSPVH